eukprot:4329192-Prymnesium_polylepis.1
MHAHERADAPDLRERRPRQPTAGLAAARPQAARLRRLLNVERRLLLVQLLEPPLIALPPPPLFLRLLRIAP